MSQSQPDADWQTIRALFEDCLDRAPASREQRLAGVAPTVREEVESLLREHDQHAGRLDPDYCHRSLLEATTDVVGIGSRIGAYRILSLIGRGGMGTVYLAEQEQPRRRVALKVLAAAVSGGEAERRFRLEAELLGRLRHHGIAQIFAADVHDEQTEFGIVRWPYFAMEYVGGAASLVTWAAAQSRNERETLAVFLQICAAVQHAHERGVVHRDLKPQNVLVDSEDRVKVIDFGIARSIDPDGMPPRALTQTGELLGTVHYMSPEQIRGDGLAIDTRTDVHALGVLLFELLTGRLPFDLAGKSLPEVGQILCETAPLPLRRLRPELDADLELILATAMAKDPSRRYATAGSLAEDLERYRLREPIRARPPSLGYQLAMFARRRRGLVVAVILLLLVSTTGGVTSLFFMLKAQRAEQQAVTDGAQKAEAMRLVFDRAMRSVLELPNKLDGAPEATRLKREVLEDAVQQLEFVEQHAPIDPAMRRSLASAYRNLGLTQGGSNGGHEGQRQAAQASLARARSHVETLLAENPSDIESLLLLAEIERETGLIYFEIDRNLEASSRHWQIADGALARLRELVPASDVRLRDAELAQMVCVAQTELTRRSFDAAVQGFERAIALRTQDLGDDELDDDSRAWAGSMYRFIGIAEMARDRPHESLVAFRKAAEMLSVCEQHLGDTAKRRLYSLVRMRLGYGLASIGQTESGEQHLRWAQTELERLFGGDSSSVPLAISLASACQLLADHLAIQAKYMIDADSRQRRYTEAQQFAARGLAIARPLHERNPEMVSMLVVAECERIAAACAQALR